MSAHPAEGNAPLTIQALTDLLGAEVQRWSQQKIPTYLFNNSFSGSGRMNGTTDSKPTSNELLKSWAARGGIS
ncbi:MAG TPA: hypothetical protein VIR02_02495 [Anaerolineales bacterium]